MHLPTVGFIRMDHALERGVSNSVLQCLLHSDFLYSSRCAHSLRSLEEDRRKIDKVKTAAHSGEIVWLAIGLQASVCICAIYPVWLLALVLWCVVCGVTPLLISYCSPLHVFCMCHVCVVWLSRSGLVWLWKATLYRTDGVAVPLGEGLSCALCRTMRCRTMRC